MYVHWKKSLFWALALTVALSTTTAMAKKGGNGGGGGGGGKPGGGGGGKYQLTVIIDPSEFSERAGPQDAVGLVSHNNPDLSSDVLVTLTSADTTEVTTPTSVTIPSGASAALFPLTVINDNVEDGDQTVSISAVADRHKSGSATITIHDAYSLPLIEYQAIRITAPYLDTTLVRLNDFNDLGMAVGWYETATGEHHAWLYDPADLRNFFNAVDLNDLEIRGLEDWVFQSAVGVNNNGLVVGYASTTGDIIDKRGFVVDLATMEAFFLPDQFTDTGELWIRTYARKVNDNGDIVGFFERADNTYGVYLFNPGLRGGKEAEEQLEILDVIVDGGFEINNPGTGVPSKIVGKIPGGTVCEYTRGAEVTYRTDLLTGSLTELVTNDYGNIAGRGSFSEEEQVVYRDMGVAGVRVEDYLIGYYGIVSGLSNEGTIVMHSGGSVTLYQDDVGFLDVNLLMAPGQILADWPAAARINNVAPPAFPGFSEIAIGTAASEFAPAELIILTPVDITPTP